MYNYTNNGKSIIDSDEILVSFARDEDQDSTPTMEETSAGIQPSVIRSS
jgi:hypothetical protein